MSMTQRYAGMLRRHSHECDKQDMPVRAECLRQAARHMEELEQERDKAMRVVDLCQRLQQMCSDWGVCWRASDSHGVDLTLEQATELLREALSVEVEIAWLPPDAHATGRADGRMIHSMRDYIEGMSVSVDVSTGEHDAHHRYFGTVTEVMDDPEDKHGVTLLVQDAKPNFSTVEKGSTQRVGTDLERDFSKAMRVVEKDKARLDWLLHNLDGGALRRIGVITSGEPALNRSAIDAAIGKSLEQTEGEKG